MSNWHRGYQVWLFPGKSLENGQKIVDHFFKDGSDWSKESISAMIGNMRHESSVNPNMYEYGYSWGADRGYGLVQWTPRSKYWNWAVAAGKDPEKAESQLDRIDYEVENNIQWIPKASIWNMTFKQFRTNSLGKNVNELTAAFTWGYERPNQLAGEKSMKDRQAFAHRAYNELDWSKNPNPLPNPPPDPEPETPEPPKLDFKIIDQFFKDFNETVGQAVKDMLTVNMFDYDASKKTFGNSFLSVNRQLENMYRISPTLNFDEVVKGIMDTGTETLKDLLGNLKPIIPPPVPDPDPPPTPTGKRVFPVDFNQSGINFWSPPHATNLERDMDWGRRSNGVWHAGYDIGGGGRTHKIYAVEDGEVVQSRFQNVSGYLIAIKHDNDEYYSLYQHMQSNLLVDVGDKVTAGQHIGNMGGTGGNYAIHLHFVLSKTQQFWSEGTTNDPKTYLGITADNKTTLPNPV